MLQQILRGPAPSVTRDFLEFGEDYFDNADVPQGYRGYVYDGRFVRCVQDMVRQFQIPRGSRVLDIGCGKGFCLKAFQDEGMDVWGWDRSLYAVRTAHPDVKQRIRTGMAHELPFESRSMDVVICKDVLPHISLELLDRSLAEIRRVQKNFCYLEIPCGRSEHELENLRLWDPTYRIHQTPEWWKSKIEEHFDDAVLNLKILIPDEVPHDVA